VILNFFEPLPDDRYTLTVSAAIPDPAGNALDGESNSSQPLEVPQFPSGDGQPGRSFTARFTVDSRPEIAVYSAATVAVDINGNFTFDTQNGDAVNRDIVFATAFSSPDLAGFDSDRFFVYTAPSGFDQLAAYGFLDGAWRFLYDLDSDGAFDVTAASSVPVDGLPFSGDFAPGSPGDEVGVFDGRRWFFDTNANRAIDAADLVIDGGAAGMRGYPLVGDFNGDGRFDLATWTEDRFYFDFSAGGVLTGIADASFDFGFSGVLERPVAADMNRDGVDDVGLWVPGRSHSLPEAASEWYFLVSDILSGEEAFGLAPPFTPLPFGNDIFAQFGDEFALPLVGNFDPPAAGALPPKSLVANLYNDLLGREPAFSELAYWNRALSRGMTPAAVATAFLTSDEHRGIVINDLYRQYLGRDADEGGLAFWTGVWRATGGPEWVQAGIIGSAEYYQHAGGTDAAWVTALYQNILGRDPDAGGLEFWVQYIQAHSKQQVVLGFVTSDEYRLALIAQWYSTYLDREVDEEGAAYWLAQMRGGTSQDAVQAALLSSQEYLALI
jgi:hypothetical protein